MTQSELLRVDRNEKLECKLSEILEKFIENKMTIQKGDKDVHLHDIEAELAAYCNISVHDIASIKAGELEPSLYLATKMAEFFNASVEKLFEGNWYVINKGDMIITKTNAGLLSYNLVTFNEKGRYVLHNVMSGRTAIEFDNIRQLNQCIENVELQTNAGSEKVVKHIPHNKVQQYMLIHLFDMEHRNEPQETAVEQNQPVFASSSNIVGTDKDASNNSTTIEKNKTFYDKW
ncbi:helix-turn-helix transcriptional regulator [Bacillus cereus]